MLLHGGCLPLDSSRICRGLEKNGHLVPVVPVPLAMESWVPCGCSVSGEQPQDPVASPQVRAGKEVRRFRELAPRGVITPGQSSALPRASDFILPLNRFIRCRAGRVLVSELQFSFLLFLNHGCWGAGWAQYSALFTQSKGTTQVQWQLTSWVLERVPFVDMEVVVGYSRWWCLPTSAEVFILLSLQASHCQPCSPASSRACLDACRSWAWGKG